MAMTKAEGWGLGAAIVAHLMLFVLLSFNFLHWKDPRFTNPPMQVDIIAETAPVSTSPDPASEAPAARLGEPDSRTIDTPPPAPIPTPVPPVRRPDPPKVITPPRPAPAPRVERPRPRPQPTARPPERQRDRPPPQPDRSERHRPDRPPPATNPPRTPPRNTATTPPGQGRANRAANDPRPTGALDGILAGIDRDAQRNARGTAAPAAASAAEVRRSIDVAINGEINPIWQRNVPSGIDVESLVITLEIRLNRDGSIAGITQIGELEGRTDSNRPQQQLFVERAIRSVRLAAPFDLPEEYYDQWRVVRQRLRVNAR